MEQRKRRERGAVGWTPATTGRWSQPETSGVFLERFGLLSSWLPISPSLSVAHTHTHTPRAVSSRVGCRGSRCVCVVVEAEQSSVGSASSLPPPPRLPRYLTSRDPFFGLIQSQPSCLIKQQQNSPLHRLGQPGRADRSGQSAVLGRCCGCGMWSWWSWWSWLWLWLSHLVSGCLGCLGCLGCRGLSWFCCRSLCLSVLIIIAPSPV